LTGRAFADTSASPENMPTDADCLIQGVVSTSNKFGSRNFRPWGAV
jgi:hypothetical protein